MAWISSIMPCGNCGADPTSYKIKKYAFIFGEHKALAALSKSIWWTMNVPEWDQLTTQVFLFIALLMALMSTFLVSSLIGMWVIFMWKYAAACWLYNLRTIARCTKKSAIVEVGKFLKKKCWCVRIWFWSLLVPKSVKWIGTNNFILGEIWTCTVYVVCIYTVCSVSRYSH